MSQRIQQHCISIPNPSSPTSQMPTATLPALPPELILDIFEATDSFATALTLSKTCQRIHGIWKANVDAILPFVVESFPQALEFAHAQEELCSRLQRPLSPRNHITMTQRISMNANLASRILQHYEARVIHASPKRGITRGPLTSNERADFLRALYRAITLAAWGKRGISHSSLEPLDMLEYMQLREAMDFVNSWFNKRSDSNICITVLQPRDLAAAMSRTSLDLTLFHLDLMRLNFDHGDFQCWSKVPFDYFTVADGYQAKAGSERGALLADLLPMLARNNFLARQNGPV